MTDNDITTVLNLRTATFASHSAVSGGVNDASTADRVVAAWTPAWMTCAMSGVCAPHANTDAHAAFDHVYPFVMADRNSSDKADGCAANARARCLFLVP